MDWMLGGRALKVRTSQIRTSVLLVCMPAALAAHASQHYGQVLSNHMPVPGATVTATQDGKRFVAITDTQGNYAFANLPDGVWKIAVEMPFFTTLEQNITVAPGAPATKWDLKVLPLAQALAQTEVVIAPSSLGVTPSSDTPKPAATAEKPTAPAPPEAPANDEGLLLNGSVNNAATSQFSLNRAFGNTRSNSRSLYNGGLGFVLGNSAFDARPYSLTGLSTPQPHYSEVTLLASIGGPINIPHFWRKGPTFSATYLWRRDSTAIAESGLVPTPEQREDTVTTTDPVAANLLAYYPLPNIAGNANYNYQVPVLNGTHIDQPQIRLNRDLGRAGGSISGTFALESTRADSTSLFGFRDNTATLGMNSQVSFDHRIFGKWYGHLSYNFSRSRNQVTPFFENRFNLSGQAGLTGTNQDPTNWGPPTLVFSSGIASLTDAQSASNRNETNSIGGNVQGYFGRHNITAGADFRRQEFNFFTQQNPRGTFTFTGQASGSDFADFLHGVPDTASIVYGNPDKYLRQSVYDVYGVDDWRLTSSLTLNLGLRWEYSAPATELKDRLANLDVAGNFASVTPVVAGDPVGVLTGQHYPTSLLRPDRSLVEPRLAFAWRPLAGSSLLVRGGYGIYADTSFYQSIALQLAQQAPFAKSISANNTTCAQSLATGPAACSVNPSDTFGIDPNFRVGFAQTWQLSAQRDLPAALQLLVTYLGIKGSNGVQEFLPNTYPIGAVNPCPQCPVGFSYQTSGGSSTREAGSIQLRRRLRSGLTASVIYTYSKSIDDDSTLGGEGPLAAGSASNAAATSTIAQNWLDLGAERSLSSFDQRHLVSAVLQYTTGMGLAGGTLLQGWFGRAYKEWTIVNTVKAGTGLPETPVYLAAVTGTGFSGSIRPDRTSAPLYTATSPGRFLNPASFTAPRAGQWGSAGRNSITGPGQLTFNSSLARTFRLSTRYNLDARVDATNLLNHVVFTSYNTTVDPTLTSPIFGLPATPAAMRSLQFTARLRF